ncbi:MAG: ABC transporter permease [Corallococcus sp.]|nr:ABC transporter permease [Corallococcus sp.]
MTNQFEKYNNIPAEKFALANKTDKRDLKFDTKPVGYFKDAFNRFCKNRGSVAGAVIILILLLFAIIVPIFSPFEVSDRDARYKNCLPKIGFLQGTGFWDGTETVEINQADFDYFNGIVVETGKPAIVLLETKTGDDGVNKYVVRRDTYLQVGVITGIMRNDEYQALQKYQSENGVQIFYPMVDTSTSYLPLDGNYWYVTDNKKGGAAIYDADGNYQNKYLAYDGKDGYDSTRIEGETLVYKYGVKVQGGYRVRYDYSEYFAYLHGGASPSFVFGTNEQGQDLFVCLAKGARFSFLLALFVSAINLTIGAIYGAIEGYYGGAADLVMERVSDILSGVPFMIVVTLFKLHLAEKVGSIPSLLFAFVLTGWIGMASNVRAQFYRFKNQEYVLAARTLGAKDFRVMFKHIFPNSLGTIITSSILVIPSVIFSESTLSYLGIINLETSNITSVGTLLSNGQGALANYPHIILFPALFISLLMISFNLFGNGLRDAFNPSLRGSED